MHIVFFRKQSKIICCIKKALKGPLCLSPPALHQLTVRKPTVASEESSLADLVPRSPAVHITFLNQLALDRRDCFADAFIGHRQEADKREIQQARVDPVAAVERDKRLQRRIKGPIADLPMHPLPHRAHPIELARVEKGMEVLAPDEAIDSGPGGDLRISVVTWSSPELP